MNTTIVRYAEIALKGRNRNVFEKKLTKNIKDCIFQNSDKEFLVTRLRGRILIHHPYIKEMKNVFGISSLSPCIELDHEVDNIKKELTPFIDKIKNKTFRVSVQRSDKNYPLTSMQLEREIGSYIVKKTGSKVNLKNFDIEIGIELVNQKAYLYTDKIGCNGGLPIGTQETVYAWVENEFSALSAILVMRRGAKVHLISDHPVDQKIVNYVKKYSYGYELKTYEVKDIDDFLSVKKATAIIYSNLQTKKGSILELYPLIKYSEKELIELYNRYDG